MEHHSGSITKWLQTNAQRYLRAIHAARRLTEAGCSASQIAAVTGHKSLREVERHVAAASQMKLADDAMAAIKSGAKFG